MRRKSEKRHTVNTEAFCPYASPVGETMDHVDTLIDALVAGIADRWAHQANSGPLLIFLQTSKLIV